MYGCVYVCLYSSSLPPLTLRPTPTRSPYQMLQNPDRNPDPKVLGGKNFLSFSGRFSGGLFPIKVAKTSKSEKNPVKFRTIIRAKFRTKFGPELRPKRVPPNPPSLVGVP